MELGLTGKSVLVAATSKGLGRACAQLFAAEGAKAAIRSRGARRSTWSESATAACSRASSR